MAKYYQYKLQVGKTINGEPVRKTFYSDKSVKDAKKKADAWKLKNEAMSLAGVLPATDVTFSFWAMKWLEIYKHGKVRENSYTESYLYPTQKHLIPFFGEYKLADIKPIDIEHFFQTKSHLSLSTLNKLKICLNGIFKSAIDNDYITKNPVNNVVFSSTQKKKEKRAYTKEQADAIIKYAMDHIDTMPNGLYIILQLSLGLRPEELFGLKWEDFDLKNKTCHIQRAVVHINHRATLTDVKSERSNRIIPIGSNVCDLLKKYPRKGMIFNILMDSSHYANGKYKNYMTKMCKELNIPVLTPHELRHTCGTILYQKTKNIYGVSKFLGHSSVRITESIYVHDNVEDMRDMVI